MTKYLNKYIFSLLANYISFIEINQWRNKMLIYNHIIYLILSSILIVFVGSFLYKTGVSFLTAKYDKNLSLAQATSKLINLGYYLVSFGFVFIYLGKIKKANTIEKTFELLSLDIGLFLIVLCVIYIFTVHFLGQAIKSENCELQKLASEIKKQ